MTHGFKKIGDFVGVSLKLGKNPLGMAALLWRQTKNLRVRLKLASHHPDQVYSLDTKFGRLHFRDNFGDCTNLLDLFYREVYRIPGELPQGDVIDVGANIGLASAWFAHRDPHRTFHCFEPLASNARMIKLNCPTAKVHQFAVGKQPGQVTLNVDPDGVMASQIDCRWKTSETTFQVVSLDSFFEHDMPERVAVLKIDAEGMEGDILQGAARILQRTEQVVLETHGHEMHAFVIDLLKNAGFLIVSDTKRTHTGIVCTARARPAAEAAEPVPESPARAVPVAAQTHSG
jgi:FkbM family methyltransferase